MRLICPASLTVAWPTRVEGGEAAGNLIIGIFEIAGRRDRSRMIKISPFLLLTFSIPRSQVRNLIRTGAEMSILEKIVIGRHHRDINLSRASELARCNRLFRAESEAIEAKPPAFFADYSDEHSTPGNPVPIAKSISSKD